MHDSVTNVVVLLDEFTRASVESIDFDTISRHAQVLTDIREIAQDNSDSAVILFEPAFHVIVTPEILNELITTFRLTVYAVYMNDLSIISLSKSVHSIKADYTTITWPFIYAIIRGDFAILEPYQKSIKVLDSFNAVKNRIPADMKDYIGRFYDSYLTLSESVSQVLTSNSTLREEIEIHESVGKQLMDSVVELQKLLKILQDQVKSYEVLLSKSYSQIFSGVYLNRPRILYITRITHLAGIDVLINTLYSVLVHQYKMSCKIVKLVDTDSAREIRYVPNVYVPITDTYNTAELLENSMILKTGGLNVMFDTLLLNRSGLDILVIHDLRNTLTPALNSNLIDLDAYEISADYASFGEYPNLITSDKRSATFLWDYTEIKSYTGTRAVRLANHPTISEILGRIL